MRIGTGAFYDSISTTVARMQRELGEMTVALSTSKKVRKPSDDPLASTVIARAYIELNSAQSRQRVLAQGISTARAADAAMGEVARGLRAAIDTTMRVLQPGRTLEDRHAASAEIRASAEAILSAANARAGDRYLFGGYQDRRMPFQEGAAGVGYLGDSGRLRVPVSEGRTTDISVPGDMLLNYVNESGHRAVPGVDADVFTVLRNMATAAESNDVDGIRRLLDDTRSLHLHVLGLRGSAGASEVRMQANLHALQDTEIRCHEILAREESIDIAEAISAYAALETSYQAVLNVMSRVISMPTVFDLTR